MADRPLHRQLVRLAFRLAPGRAHWQDAWPGLVLRRPAGATAGAALWHGRPVARLAPLAELPRAETVTVVGSGPSMGGVAPERLPGLAILLNGAVTLAPRLERAILAIEDERFVHRRWDLVAADWPAGWPCLLSVAALRAIAAQDAGWLAGRDVVLLDNLLKPYGAPRRRADAPDLDRLLCKARGAAVSRDPQVGVVVAGTVALSAVQVALALAPRRVALAGVDLGGPGPRFYEREGEAAWSGLAAGQARILAHFAAAGVLAEERGIRMETVTPGSALEEMGVPCAPLP